MRSSKLFTTMNNQNLCCFIGNVSAMSLVRKNKTQKQFKMLKKLPKLQKLNESSLFNFAHRINECFSTNSYFQLTKNHQYEGHKLIEQKLTFAALLNFSLLLVGIFPARKHHIPVVHAQLLPFSSPNKLEFCQNLSC